MADPLATQVDNNIDIPAYKHQMGNQQEMEQHNGRSIVLNNTEFEHNTVPDKDADKYDSKKKKLYSKASLYELLLLGIVFTVVFTINIKSVLGKVLTFMNKPDKTMVNLAMENAVVAMIGGMVYLLIKNFTNIIPS